MNMKMTEKEFCTLCQKCFCSNSLSEFAATDCLSQFYRMVDHMLQVNSTMNLTAITEPYQIIIKHLADSLTVAKYIPHGASLLDVGCGGGFPSLPLAIARPDLRITALDSTAKKTTYVSKSARLLGLDNLTTLTGRAETLAHDMTYREQYDVAIARAVASLPVLCELCIPFVKIGGYMIAMKAKNTDEPSGNAAQKLGSARFVEYTLSLYGNEIPEERSILISQKQKMTDNTYPRPYSRIKNKPL